MRVKKLFALGLICSVLLTQTGCWNNTDITRLAIATAVGIDMTDGNQYSVSVQIIKPPSSASSGSENSSVQGQDTFVITGRGSSIFEALRCLLNSLGRKIFYTNVQVIVLGEDVAKQGISDALDFYERQHETQLKTYLLVAKGSTAKKIIETKSDMESVAAINMAQVVENARYRMNVDRMTLLDLLCDQKDKGKNMTIGMIKLVSPKVIRIEGTAVFKGDKMVGELSPYETRGFRLAVRKIQNGLITIKNPGDPKKNIELEIASSRPSIKVDTSQGKPSFTITIKNTGSIAEVEGRDIVTGEYGMKLIEESYKKEVKNEVENTIRVLQTKLDSDIIGLGDYLHKHNLGYWKSIKGNWDEEFSKADITVEVETHISRTGQIRSKGK